jgi:phosphoglycerate dehydrogenase-like enzyme
MSLGGDSREIAISGNAFPEEVKQRLSQAGFTVKTIAGDLDEKEVVGALAGVWGYVLGGTERIGAGAWESLPDLRCVCVLGTGVEPFLKLPRGESRIAFTYTPHANVEAVAELTVGMSIALLRRLSSRVHGVVEGKWLKDTTPSLAGATVGIVGMGHIGRAVARMLHTAFGADVCYWNRSDRDRLSALPYTRYGTVLEVMQAASLVSLHCTYVSGDNDGMIGTRELQALGPSGHLVNTGRAQLVDPDALRQALESDAIAGAAFDGYYAEPAPSLARDRLGLMRYLETDKLIVTPHCAYLTAQATRAMAELAADNLAAVAHGEPPPHPVPR